MRVTINGKPNSIEDGFTVARLLDQLDLQPIRVAVELNEDIVSRKTFEQTELHEGDRIEIVTFVGGG